LRNRLAFRVNELADALNVSAKTIKTTWFQMGLMHSKIGGITFIKPEWVEEFLDKYAESIDPDEEIRAGLSDFRESIEAAGDG
jgi:hypothetical protein